MIFDIKNMTLREKVGQMIGLAFSGTSYSEELKMQIEDMGAGLIIFFKDNCGNPRQIFELNKIINDKAKIAPFIALDQEGGMVARVTEGIVQSPGAMAITAGSTTDECYKLAYNMGVELKKLGFNFNFAPDADVNNNPLNPVINVRSYSENPHVVAEYMLSAVQGYHDAGMMTSIKHFPGHGDTAVDSHLGLPVVAFSKKRLNEVELVPFNYAIKSNLPGIMASHILYSNIDDTYPTTMSKKVIHDFLREELGFNGLVVTDSLTMKAVWGRYSIREIVEKSFNSGCDIMLLCGARDINMQKEFFETAVELAEKGIIDNKLIDESVERILKYKALYANNMADSFEEIEHELNNQDSVKFAQEVMDNAVTIIKDDNKLIPLKKEEKVLVVFPVLKVVTLVENPDNTLNSLGDYLSMPHDKMYVDIIPTKEQKELLLNKEREYDKIIYCSYSACLYKEQSDFINELDKKKLIVIALRTPYDYNYLDVSTYLTAYEASKQAFIALAKVLDGTRNATGKCPVTLNNK